MAKWPVIGTGIGGDKISACELLSKEAWAGDTLMELGTVAGDTTDEFLRYIR